MTNAIRIARTGGPEVMEWQSVEVGEPGPGEVVIDQRAVGLNYIDVYHRTGQYPLPLPFTPGLEGAGVIEAVGEGVTNFGVGDRVAYCGAIGGYAQRRLITADKLVALPDGIDFDTGAAAMLKGLTAHMLLRKVRRVEAGDTILVHAAAGGVGLFLCQWAAALGCTVIGTVSTAAKAELARAHGCQHPIVTTDHDFVEQVASITGGKKLPVVYDSVGRDTFMKSLDCLWKRGILASFGQSSGGVEPFSPGVLAAKGSLFLTRPTLFDYIAERTEYDEAAAELFGMIEAGRIKVEIGQRYTLADAATAHRDLEARRTTGSTVLTVGAP
ncbi:MAG: quinone oxidoreductase [Sphingomicrobium sp.]